MKSCHSRYPQMRHMGQDPAISVKRHHLQHIHTLRAVKYSNFFFLTIFMTLESLDFEHFTHDTFP